MSYKVTVSFPDEAEENIVEEANKVALKPSQYVKMKIMEILEKAKKKGI